MGQFGRILVFDEGNGQGFDHVGIYAAHPRSGRVFFIEYVWSDRNFCRDERSGKL